MNMALPSRNLSGVKYALLFYFLNLKKIYLYNNEYGFKYAFMTNCGFSSASYRVPYIDAIASLVLTFAVKTSPLENSPLNKNIQLQNKLADVFGDRSATKNYEK